MHQRARVGNRIDHLVFVGPPIGESGSHGTMSCHRIGHLVAFENMLKRTNLDTEVIERPDQCEDLVLPITVAVNPTIPVDDFGNRFKLKIASGWQTLSTLIPSFPCRVILFCRMKFISHDLLDAHTSLGIAGGVFISPVGLFDIFTEREFDSRRGEIKFHIFIKLPPPKLDHLVLPTDWIGRAMQDVGRRDPACQLPVNIDVITVDKIADSNFRRDRLTTLIDSAIGGHMRMTIDDPRGQMHAVSFDFHHVIGDIEIQANRGNPSINDQDVAFFNRSLFSTSPNRHVSKDDARMFVQQN